MPISTARLPLLSDFLAGQIGLRLAPARWPELKRAVEYLARLRQCDDLDAFAERLMTRPLARDDVAALAQQLSVGETYFFRDPALFAALEQSILPALIAARRAAADRRLSIWSAGCSSGEELYSLAIVLSRLLPDERAWDLRLVGTDIDPIALAKATRGVYRDWSFRGLPQTVRPTYFRACGDGEFGILPMLQQRVHFAYHNLAGTEPPPMPPPHGYDLVLCRNVLMYFDDAVIVHATAQLETLLAHDGWLVVSAAESGHAAFTGYAPVFCGDTLLYRRQQAEAGSKAIGETGSSNEVPAFAAPDAEYTAGLLQAHAASADRLPRTTPSSLDNHRRDTASHARRDSQGQAEQRAQRMAQRARTLANRGELERALRWARAAVATDKCDASLRYLLALIHHEQGNAADAVASLKHALYLDPDFSLAHLCLANVYRKLDRQHDAQRHLDIAAALLHALPDAHPLAHAGGIAVGHLRGWTGRPGHAA